MRAALSLSVALLLWACTVPRPEVILPASPPPPAARPTYALGERWIRNDGVYELSRLRSDEYVFTREDGREIHLTKDLVIAGVFRYGLTLWEFTPPPSLAWPLEVGKRATHTGYWRLKPDEPRARPPSLTDPWWRSPGALGPLDTSVKYTPAILTWVVEAYEDVRVPAGTFPAFRIFFEITPANQPAPASWLRMWYAPALRQLVKAEGREPLGFQLVALDPAATAPLEVALHAPDPARLSGAEALVGVRATSGKGVARVTVALNGEDVTRRGDGEEPQAERSFTVRVTLREGQNVLLVTATDAAGATRQEARTLVYDPAALRAAAEDLRKAMLAARDAATRAEVERLAPDLWATAAALEREAEAALGTPDFARARTSYREAREAYERAEGAGRRAALLARTQAEARQAEKETAEARRAAEIAGAATHAAGPWARATAAQREAEEMSAHGDFPRALERFREAAEAYRDAEREAVAAAAAAERQRLAALRRQLEAAQEAAAAAAASGREAEQAGAPRYAPTLFGPAEERERQGQAALDRRDFAAAQRHFRDAEQAYRRAAEEARRVAEVEQRQAAARAHQQGQAEQLRAQMAEARRQAEQADARRWAAPLWTAAAASEADGQAALGRREYPTAGVRFREARQAYDQAALEAKKAAEAALPPLRIALASPHDQTRVAHDAVGLSGVVSSGRGVRRVVVTLDGVEVGRLDQANPPRSLPVNLPVRLREGQNTLVLTATEADGTIHQEVRTVHYERPVPLTVSIRYPEEQARFRDEATVLAAVVESSKGVARVTVTLNGTEIHQRTERTPQKSMALALPIALRDGPNAIVVTAAEPDGTVRQEVRTVVYEGPKVVTATATAPPERRVPDRWAVVIGVGRYEHPEIPRLSYAVADAEAVSETLIGAGGFSKDRVLLLTDRTDRRPTIKNLRWALGTFLARMARKDDTVFIFFAGHGAPEIDLRGEERDGFTKYLVPIDAEPDDLFSTALPMDDIETIFRRIEAERVVAFLDTCYSGAAGGRTFASKRTRAGQVDDAFLERLARSKGRVIVTAARPSEVSVELAELGHGLFTYYLVQGLRGAADLNRDGIVALQELYEYVEREVTQKSRAVGANQHPVLKGELEGVLPLVKVPR